MKGGVIAHFIDRDRIFIDPQKMQVADSNALADRRACYIARLATRTAPLHRLGSGTFDTRSLEKMAEALALIGLTSSIITFIQFGSKLLLIAKSANDARDGALAEVRELDLMVRDITERRFKLTNTLSSGESLLQCDRITEEMANECTEVAGQLRALVMMLTIRKHALSRTLESGRVAFKSMSKAQEMKELRSRLIALDSAVRRNLEEALQRYDIYQS